MTTRVVTGPLPELDHGPRFLGRWQSATDALARRAGWLPPLLARIALGFTFASTGWGKLQHIEKVTGYFTDLGLPAPGFLARFVGATEFICGLLVFSGLLTRLAAIPLIVVLAVAIGTARLEDVHGLADFLGLQELTYMLLLFWLVIRGPGRVSLDRMVVGRLERWDTPAKDRTS